MEIVILVGMSHHAAPKPAKACCEIAAGGNTLAFQQTRGPAGTNHVVASLGVKAAVNHNELVVYTCPCDTQKLAKCDRCTRGPTTIKAADLGLVTQLG